MPEGSDEQPVGVLRIDGDFRDLLGVAQAEVCPRLAGVGGLVDAVARGQVWARQPFSTPDINNVGVGERDADPADGSSRLIVEDRLPGPAGVGGLPDAAVADAYIKGVRQARMAGRGLGPAGTIRADVAPAHVRKQRGTDLARRLLRGHR